MNVKTLVSNGILAALHIAVSELIHPFGFTYVQFRIFVHYKKINCLF